MAYTVPNFNLLASIWDCRFPADGAADWEDVPVQKYLRSRMSLDVGPQVEAGWWQNWTPPIQLRFPRDHEAFMDPPALWNHLSFEVPAGSGQYYRCQWQEVQHQGFPNEYAIILVTPCDEAGLAIPPPSADTPVGSAPDICTIPPPDVDEEQYGEFIVDDAAFDIMGYIARATADDTFYAAYMHGPSGQFILAKVVGGTATTLDSAAWTSPPSHNGTLDLICHWEGESLSARFITTSDDVTLTATDSALSLGQCDSDHLFRNRCSLDAEGARGYVASGVRNAAHRPFTGSEGWCASTGTEVATCLTG